MYSTVSYLAKTIQNTFKTIELRQHHYNKHICKYTRAVFSPLKLSLKDTAVEKAFFIFSSHSYSNTFRPSVFRQMLRYWEQQSWIRTVLRGILTTIYLVHCQFLVRSYISLTPVQTYVNLPNRLSLLLFNIDILSSF